MSWSTRKSTPLSPYVIFKASRFLNRNPAISGAFNRNLVVSKVSACLSRSPENVSLSINSRSVDLFRSPGSLEISITLFRGSWRRRVVVVEIRIYVRHVSHCMLNLFNFRDRSCYRWNYDPFSWTVERYLQDAK